MADDKDVEAAQRIAREAEATRQRLAAEQAERIQKSREALEQSRAAIKNLGKDKNEKKGR